VVEGIVDGIKARAGLIGLWYRLKLGGDHAVVLRMQTKSPYVGNVLTLFDEIDGELLPICEIGISPAEWAMLFDRGRLTLADDESTNGSGTWAGVSTKRSSTPRIGR
jgi:hypothetical protein